MAVLDKAPRLSISIVIWILSSDTGTSAATPLGARVGESVESALSALAAIFLALSAYFNNFRQKIPDFDASRQKRVLFNCFATKQCFGILKM